MPTTVTLVSAVNPFPTDAGKKVVLAGFLEYLVDRVGPGNVHYLLVGGQPDAGFPSELHPLPRPRRLTAMFSVLTRTTTGRASIQESLLRSQQVSDAIRTTQDRLSPALEIYDTVRMAQYASEQRAQHQICYLDDLFSERYRAMLLASERYPDVDISPLGNFATHVPQVLRPLAELKASQRLLLRVEQDLVGRSEDRVVDRFRTSLLVNEQEAALLRRRTGAEANRVRSIPPLISSPKPQRTFCGAPEFVFLGLLSLPHNDDGLRAFLNSTWPLIIAARPDARLRVVGRHPRPALLDVIARYADSVTLEGFVPDLTGLLGSAAALVNPLRFGSGIKLKIIEALGHRVPVVTSSIGAEGVTTGADEGMLVSDSSDEQASLLLELIDPVCNARLSAAAGEHFNRRYSRTAVFECYDEAFGLG